MSADEVAPGDLTPHPYALELPPLSDDERTALKEDIAAHGILYAPIVDEDNQVLDGVHRVTIATELGIDRIAVNRVFGASDERKCEIAYGTNLRRRHLSREARDAVISRLHESGKSAREIAKLTGWSKSTVNRITNPPRAGAAPPLPVPRGTSNPTVPNGTSNPTPPTSPHQHQYVCKHCGQPLPEEA